MNTINNNPKKTKFKKWKFAPNRKIFISEKKLSRWIEKEDITIYDTRDIENFKKDNLENSINVSPILIKAKILEHNKEEKIILVGNNFRTNTAISSWARYNNYKNVFLVDKKVALAFSSQK